MITSKKDTVRYLKLLRSKNLYYQTERYQLYVATQQTESDFT